MGELCSACVLHGSVPVVLGSLGALCAVLWSCSAHNNNLLSLVFKFNYTSDFCNTFTKASEKNLLSKA